MTAKLFVEGSTKGPDSKLLQSRCREAFKKLLEKSGFAGRLPRVEVCGGRGAAYRDFSIGHANSVGAYIGLFVDSEDPIADIEQTWMHLKQRDGWEKPAGADDEQVLLMATCMETWIASDRPTLRSHYGAKLQEGALPSLFGMESRPATPFNRPLNMRRENARTPTRRASGRSRFWENLILPNCESICQALYAMNVF